MGNRKVPFVNNEFYHIYNRGVDKRDVFLDNYDLFRFLQSMEEFNSIDPIGSIYEQSFKKNNQLSGATAKEKLVEFIAFCLNKNHYHFILQQLSENGISEFMRRLGCGYTWYFNNKYDRSGSLFQGKFKSKYINTNEYLLHLSAYVNLNDKVHKLGGELGGRTAKFKSLSSWDEYTKENHKKDICRKDIVLKQFKSKAYYDLFANESLKAILEKRSSVNDLLME